MSRDRASEQLKGHAARAGAQPLTASNGAPLDSLTNSATAGPRGPIVLQDFALIDYLAHFDRERIPERVVHAKGGGAFGYFEVTHPEITRYCKAHMFSEVGLRTPMAIRFSTVAGELGAADTVRDPRGFSMKFYTREGNWDLVGNNTPIFFIRDPILFPSFIHTQKRNPVTHLHDDNAAWDFFSLRPETAHQVSFVFSDRGIPDGHRHMNGYGSHAFKNVNAAGEAFYVKYHFKTDQGIKNIPPEEAAHIASTDPDYAIRDLYNAIANEAFPSWTMYIQVMTEEQAATARVNPFDVTKIWPHSEYPLMQVGRFVLNRNPENYFAEIEQLAFCPSHMVPGVEPSPDKMLQGRLFSYSDTHRHRLGANYQQLPVNKPVCSVTNYQRDGFMTVENQRGAPNYWPNSFGGPATVAAAAWQPQTTVTAVRRYVADDEDNFSQVGEFFRKVLSPEERERLCDNIAGSLCNAEEFIQKRAISNFAAADARYGQMVADKIKARRAMRKPTPLSRPAAPLNPPRKVVKAGL